MATTPSLRRTSARSRAVSPPLNLPALQPSTTVDDSKRMLQHHVAHPEKSAPSDVKIKVIIKRIDHVDTEKQAFFAELWVGAWDIDDDKPIFSEYFQAQHHALGPTSGQTMFDHGKPQWTVALQNVQDLVHFYKLKQLPETRQTVDGKHLIRYHVQGNFSSVFDLTWFPFDKQKLTIKISLDIGSNIAKINDLVSVTKDNTSFDLQENSEWLIDYSVDGGKGPGRPYHELNNRDASAAGSAIGISYHTVTIVQHIKRNPSHFVMTAFFPLLIIIACSFLMIHPYEWVHLIRGRSDGKILETDRLAYLSTMLLSVIALRFSFVDKMPRIPYLSLFDVVFMTSYWILFNMMCVAAEQRTGALVSLLFIPFLLYQGMQNRIKIWCKKTILGQQVVPTSPR